MYRHTEIGYSKVSLSKEIGRIQKSLLFDGKIVSEQHHEIAIAFLFALETAMRQGEIWSMKWRDVYLKKRFVRLHETKNGTKRDVPLSTEAVRLLKLLSIDNCKVFTTNQQPSATIFRRCLSLSGIKVLTRSMIQDMRLLHDQQENLMYSTLPVWQVIEIRAL